MSLPLPELYSQKQEAGELQPDPGQITAVKALERLRGDLTKPPEKKFWRRRRQAVRGVYLWGGVGRGKTMLMDLFYASLPDEVSKRRIHFHEFMIAVHDYLHRARKENGNEAAFLDFAKKTADEARVLCFDEFHVTDIADAMILGRLFEALFKRGVAIVATSNWPPERLYEGGLQRDRFLPFIDLMTEKMQVVEVTGKNDYRLQCLSDTGVYFTGKGAQKWADEVFARLTGDAKPYEEELTVRGRALHVGAVAKGVARFSFADLCEKPLGAEDYLRIAQSYHTVFVEVVPKMGLSQRNEAKRFITLIDTLYDTRTKLVMTAAAAPDKLYSGSDHKFEFSRTISRLMEMQSTGYLQG